MKMSFSDRLRDSYRVLNGTIRLQDLAPVGGEFLVKVVRADGRVEYSRHPNVVTDRGLNRLANRMVVGATTSVVYVLGLGTQTAAHSLGSVQAGIGEVSRKSAATVVQSREWFALTMSWAGNTDGLTSVALDSIFITDHPNSHASTGIIAAVANGLAVTLGASDFLQATYQCRVGSHNLNHST